MQSCFHQVAVVKAGKVLLRVKKICGKKISDGSKEVGIGKLELGGKKVHVVAHHERMNSNRCLVMQMAKFAGTK